MNLFRLARFFLPLQNPAGFGVVDFLALALAAVLVGLILVRSRLEGPVRRLAANTRACMLLLAALPVALRLALLGKTPVPIPRVADDFSYLLLADTLAHFRLANPAHPMHRFFEGVFFLQQPTYSSIYPLGQGLVLALGKALFGHPWAGVVLSVAALCSLCYWMLRGWTTATRALAGGLLAVFEFGPLSPWMNIYWGGAVSAVAGCLIFGSLPRLEKQFRTREAVLLGAGLGLQLLTRPFEFVLTAMIVAVFFRPMMREPGKLARIAAVSLLTMLPALGLTLLQNKQVTGNWTTLPYVISRYQYGVPTTFTMQPNPVPHQALTLEQQIDYAAQVEVHGHEEDTVLAWLGRLKTRLRYYRFFFLAPLYLALPGFICLLRRDRNRWIAGAVLFLAAATGFYPYFYPHYIAVATCLFVLIGVRGLERLSSFKTGREAAQLILLLCFAHFLFWYGIRMYGDPNVLLALSEYETQYAIATGDPEGRIAIEALLDKAEGKQLVFVRYSGQHGGHEWIHNEADIDKARVVRALDLGEEENAQLRRYYPDRKVWLLEPDSRPPRLTPWAHATIGTE